MPLPASLLACPAFDTLTFEDLDYTPPAGTDHWSGTIPGASGRYWIPGAFPADHPSIDHPTGDGLRDAAVSHLPFVFVEVDPAGTPEEKASPAWCRARLEEQLEHYAALVQSGNLPAPTFMVLSGDPRELEARPGKSIHVYWQVSDPWTQTTLPTRTLVMATLGAVVGAGADSTIRNPGRKMRMPGGEHQRRFQTIIHAGGPVYTQAELSSWADAQRTSNPTLVTLTLAQASTTAPLSVDIDFADHPHLMNLNPTKGGKLTGVRCVNPGNHANGDATPSAYVGRNTAKRRYLSCSTCKTTWWDNPAAVATQALQPSPAAASNIPALTYPTDTRGNIKPGYAAAILDLRANPAFSSLQFDTFRETVYIHRRPLADADLLDIRTQTIGQTQRDHGKEATYDAVMQVARNERPVNPVLDYFRGLKWDTVSRLDSWLAQAFGIAALPIERAYCRKFLLCAAARVLQPGCKVDDCLVLIGGPGTKKSTLLRELVPDPSLFTDAYLEMKDKDSLLKLQQVLLVEIGEAHDFSAGGPEATKRFLSIQADLYRSPYERVTGLHQRHCVFCVTTNERRPPLFRDPSAQARRFWPISLYDRQMNESADLAWVRANRDQLWAEAIVAVEAGEPWWFDTDAEKLAHAEHFAGYLESDPLVESVVAALSLPANTAVLGVPFILSAMMRVLGFRTEDVRKHVKSVERALREVGYAPSVRGVPTGYGNRAPTWVLRSGYTDFVKYPTAAAASSAALW